MRKFVLTQINSIFPAAPTLLTATRTAPLTIGLNWTDNSTTETGFAIERGTDGINFTQIATVSASVTTYSDTAVVEVTTYYYRVRAYLSSHYSDYTNTANATTTYVNGTFTLTATGTGLGISVLDLTVSAEVVITLSGTARFYTDVAATIGASATWTVSAAAPSPAAQVRYIRLASGTSTMTVTNIGRITQFGGTNWTGFDQPVNAPALSGDVGRLTNCTILSTQGALNALSGDISLLSPNLTRIVVEGVNTLHGDLSAFTDLVWVTLWGNHTCTCDITNLVNLIHFDYHGSATAEVSGSVTGLAEIVFLEVREPLNFLTGSITNMPHLYNYWMVDPTGPNNQNTISGSIAGKPDLIIFADNGTTSAYTGNFDASPLTGNIRLYGTNHRVEGDFGLGTIAADIGDIYLESCGITTYTNGATWGDIDVVIIPAVGYGLSSTEVDNMLIDMANSVGGPTGSTITLTGSNAARTAASNAAVSTLQGRGCTVTTN